MNGCLITTASVKVNYNAAAFSEARLFLHDFHQHKTVERFFAVVKIGLADLLEAELFIKILRAHV